MKYIKLFDDHSDYEDYVDGGLMSYPNVSYCIEEDELHYMKESPAHDYSKDYLTFEVVEAGTISVMTTNNSASKTIQYSTDNGSTWTSLTTSTTAQSLGAFVAGDKVLLKGVNTSYSSGSAVSPGPYNNFSSTAKFNIYGNIMSLIYGDNFIGQTTLTGVSNFRQMFRDNNNIISIEHLILPADVLTDCCYADMFLWCQGLTTMCDITATHPAEASYIGMFYHCSSLVNIPESFPDATLANRCYEGMLRACTSITKAPILPSKTLVNKCYTDMFDGSTSVNYIKCLATDISATGCTDNWLNNVASSGTFVKDANTTWSSGKNGIPSGWTVQDAT